LSPLAEFKGEPELIYRYTHTDGGYDAWFSKVKGVPNTLGIFGFSEPAGPALLYFGCFTNIPWTDDNQDHRDQGKSFIFKVRASSRDLYFSEGNAPVKVFKHKQGAPEVYHSDKPRSLAFYNFGSPNVDIMNKTVGTYLSDWYECEEGPERKSEARRMWLAGKEGEVPIREFLIFKLS